MFLLFLPSHILSNLPSLLPSLAGPSIQQAAARKPGSIHRSSSKHQLIIFPAITHLPLHLPLISSTVNISFVRQKLRRPRLQRAAGHAKHLIPALYVCRTGIVFLIRGMMLQVFWCSLTSARRLIPWYSNIQAWQQAAVSHSLFCSTPNWGNLLS